MPTSSKVAKKLINSLPDTIDGAVYELGAGWGTLAFPLAKKYPLNAIKAYENSLIPYLFCRLRSMIFSQPNLIFHCSDFYDQPLYDAGLIVCYLYTGGMQKLKTKFDSEVNTKTLIVSNTFSIPGLKPLKILEINDIYLTKIFYYHMPK